MISINYNILLWKQIDQLIVLFEYIIILKINNMVLITNIFN